MSWSLTHCIKMQRITVAVNTEGENPGAVGEREKEFPSHQTIFFIAFPMM